MRPFLHRPSSVPPVSDRDLEVYAGKWVIVRGGKVVLQASSYDDLAARRQHVRPKDGDKILRLPPVASASNSGDAAASQIAVGSSVGSHPPVRERP
jgi:hypothetical protein